MKARVYRGEKEIPALVLLPRTATSKVSGKRALGSALR